MDTLPPIPTPPAQRWREFRIQVLPLVVFVCVVTSLVMMWRTFVQPIGLVAQVEVVSADVISYQDGLLTELTVDRYEHVTKGQPIGQVINNAPELVKANLDAAVADLNVLRERMKVDENRREQNYQQLWQDLILEKIKLIADQARLVFTSNELNRAKELGQDNIQSISNIEKAQSEFDSLKGSVVERIKFIDDFDKNLKSIQPDPTPTTDPVQFAIEKKIKEVEELLKPIILKAPIDGIVSLIKLRPGETVLKGSPILTVSAPTSERIVGYIRQPINNVPTTNDTVMVRTRTQRRQVAAAQILKVGTSLEAINPALLSVDTKRMEVGLPILVSIPAGLHLVPGEYVDLAIQYSRK